MVDNCDVGFTLPAIPWCVYHYDSRPSELARNHSNGIYGAKPVVPMEPMLQCNEILRITMKCQNKAQCLQHTRAWGKSGASPSLIVT